MGEARVRKMQRQQQNKDAITLDYSRIARAIRHLTEAASANYGADCVLQSWLARELLSTLGVSSEIRVGFASWRVGDGDGDVIIHAPTPGMPTPWPGELPYHAWLQVGDFILDVTTSQLSLKAAHLDAMDGGTTQVDWAPEFLLIPVSGVSNYDDVRKGGAGLCYYEPRPDVQALIMKTFSPDPEDAVLVRFLYEHPQTHVFGPDDGGRRAFPAQK